MLKELKISNLVLVESATLQLGPAFNVLSGESGSGKSAIMHALDLAAGSRSDLSLLRRDTEKGSVEALFLIDHLPALLHLLEESGIEHEAGCELIIKREISSNGKSRAFINHQSVQTSLLKQITEHLFEVSGQHANQKLLNLDYHRYCIDLFGNLEKNVQSFCESWEQENRLKEQLNALVNSKAQQARELEICQREIEEIRNAKIQEGEEEEAFQEYTQLCNADELAQKSEELDRLFHSERTGILPLLNRCKYLIEQLHQLAPTLTETNTSFQNAQLEFQEIAHTLRQFASHIEHNPKRADALNERLEQIAKIKRKYGNTLEEIQSYLEQTEKRLHQLENADANIESLQEEIKILQNQNELLASDLTKKRKAAAKKFEKQLIEHLRSLNMPKAEFIVHITPQKRSKNGDDKIEFFLIPNVGENQVSLRECASGGELSRTLLSIQVLLADKEKTPILIFDEIDANIGGETATIVGKKLAMLAESHQVLCITHFSQVAAQASHHLRIAKTEKQGRTITTIDTLSEKSSRQQELNRMLGITTS